MWMLITFWVITLVMIVVTIKYKKPVFLLVPFGLLFGMLLVQIAMVPMPFWDTVEFIFNLR
ncbi:hypothetical protein B0H94_10621 [Salsuginibacillus halophilus]|uniref:Uncharacterized protein n=1 Tax=Salsuginibacillus halophilus TaxID=517424 RepID=A0A2P8HHS3_9BACI|nr:hypothetical protein [Salsuginibacillus halophilus]PSL45766.1 hypothetical protein B0H94_10621 [Salsuginibacillus halophilus]